MVTPQLLETSASLKGDPGHAQNLRLHIIIFGTIYILLIVIVTFFYVM